MSTTSDDTTYMDLLEVTLTEFITEYVRTQPEDCLLFSLNYFENLNRTNKWERFSKSINMARIHRTISSEMPGNSKQKPRRIAVMASKSNDEEQSIDISQIRTVKKDVDLTISIKNAARKVFMFRALDQGELNIIVDSMFQRDTKPGDVIIHTGDEGDYFYVIQSGVYEAFTVEGVEPILVKHYDNEGAFGEISLMYNCPRSATVITRIGGILWCLDKTIFRKIVFHKAIAKRQTHEQFLRNVPLFKNFSNYEINTLADAISYKNYDPKEVIIKQGEIGNDMFIVESGEVAVLKNEYNIDREIIRLGMGNYFGELSLLYDAARTATVTAITPTTVLVIDRDSFERLLGNCVDIMERNASKYSENKLQTYHINVLLMIYVMKVLVQRFSNDQRDIINIKRTVKAVMVLIPLFGIQIIFTIYRVDSHVYVIFSSIIYESQALWASVTLGFLNREVRSTISLHSRHIQSSLRNRLRTGSQDNERHPRKSSRSSLLRQHIVRKSLDT